MTEWLANIKIEYILIAVAVLFAARLILGKYKTPVARSAAEIVESALIAIVLVFLIIRPFIVQAFFIPSESMEPTLLGHDYPRPVHDHILVNKFIYRFKEPQRGDIIVFKSPPGISLDGQERDFIKRLIGVSGDVIEVKAGYVMVDGARYEHRDLDQFLFQDPAEKHAIKLREDGVLADGQLYSRTELARILGGSDVRIVPGQVIRNGKLLREAYVMEDPDYTMRPFRVPPGKLFVMGDNRNNSNDSHAWGPLDRNRVIGKAMVRFWPLNRVGLVH